MTENVEEPSAATVVDALTAYYGKERDVWSLSKVRRMRAALATVLSDQSQRIRQLTEQASILESAWDMLHFSCDNPDHAEAYKIGVAALGYGPKQQSEVVRLRQENKTYGKMVDDLLAERDELAARLGQVRKYADERAWYGQRNRTVGSNRIASDLLGILGLTEVEGTAESLLQHRAWEQPVDLGNVVLDSNRAGALADDSDLESWGPVEKTYLNDPPRAVCDRCGRFTYDENEVDTSDTMPQPNGFACGGTFIMIGSARL